MVGADELSSLPNSMIGVRLGYPVIVTASEEPPVLDATTLKLSLAARDAAKTGDPFNGARPDVKPEIVTTLESFHGEKGTVFETVQLTRPMSLDICPVMVPAIVIVGIAVVSVFVALPSSVTVTMPVVLK